MIVDVPRIKVPARKWQSFGVACCRELWPWIEDSRCRRAVEVGEAFADGHATRDELGEASEAAFAMRTDLENASRAEAEAMLCFPAVTDYGSMDFYRHPAEQATLTVDDAENFASHFSSDMDVAALLLRLAGLLKDILGNPFRPVAFSPSWRTEHAVGIAVKMYEDRHFAAMPILADALEEAGCENDDILSHCREPGVHVRGCWVVDLVLGK